MTSSGDKGRSAFEMATEFHQQGRIEKAEWLYREALAQNPDDARALHQLGVALAQQEKGEEALALLQRAAKANPDAAAVQSDLGVLFKTQGRLEEAAMCFRKVIAADPDHAEGHYNLGALLQALGKLDEAIGCYEHTLALDPDFAEAHYNLGCALQTLGHHGRAIACFEAALAIDPDYAEARSNLGLALLEIGQLAEAREAFTQHIALKPPNPAASYCNLVQCARVSADDPHLADMIAMAEAPSTPADERLQLHFGIAKAYDDLGRHEDAFSHLLRGNALKRQQATYDEHRTLALFTRIRKIFTAELVRERAGLGHPSAVPIFIVGMPRSGSTLVEQILASHPQIFGVGEIPIFSDTLAALHGKQTDQPSYPNIAPLLYRDDLRRLGARYLEQLTRAAPSADRITDKTLINFMYVGLIHLVFPNARILHTRRDPIDTCISCFSKLFTSGLPYTYGLGELGRYYRAYAALMEHWQRVLPEGAVIDVPYEALVADIEGEARRIIAQCGLTWDDACLTFYETRRVVRTASAAQVRQRVYQSSVGRWRHYDNRLRPLLDALEVNPE